VRPEWRTQLPRRRSLDRNREAAIAFAARSDDLPAVLDDEVFDQRIVSSQGGAHGLGVPDPGNGAALDVGKEKGDGPVGQSR
jgi:hypothetical protein